MRRFFSLVMLATCLATLLVVGACDNEATFEAQISPQLPKGAAKVKSKVFKNKQSGTFNFDGQQVEITCKVTLTGIVDGQPFAKTVEVKLSQTGAKGASYEMDCTDPLLIQFPADAYNFTATYVSDTGVTGGLPITSNLTAIATEPGKVLKAEPGTRFVLISFPPNMPDGDVTLTLDFDLRSIRPIAIKSMIVAKASCGADTYYPPIVPAGTVSMASVPALTIPVSAAMQPIPLPLDTVTSPAVVDIACR
jgi:hypothetical protein